VLLKDGTL